MPRFIDRDEVQQLVEEQDAMLAEVLPHAEYEWAHLPGALHLPLKGWRIEKVHAQLDKDKPVIVYCNDYQ